MDDFEKLLNGGKSTTNVPVEQANIDFDFDSLTESTPAPQSPEPDEAYWEGLTSSIEPVPSELFEPSPISQSYIDGYTEGVNAIITDPRNGIATKGAIVTAAAISRAGGWKLNFETTEDVLGAHVQDIRKGAVRLIAVPEQHFNKSIDDAVNALILAIQAHQ